ncbi:MAG: hypothetical protein NTW27_04920 [Deltaproteobacteria bacterium]|nr:hypothetical protein [Deltaproteobacteria bacterium]
MAVVETGGFDVDPCRGTNAGTLSESCIVREEIHQWEGLGRLRH